MAVPQTRIEMVRQWARVYWDLGYNPVPCIAKKPCCTYADHWKKKFPRDHFARFAATDVQLMTGAYWNLVVIDLDSAAGMEWFFEQFPACRYAKNWTVRTAKGFHLWYRLPKDWPFEVKSRRPLQRNADGTTAVDLLGDHALAKVPPSLGSDGVSQYRFVDQYRNPIKCDKPPTIPHQVLEYVPPWVLEEAARREAAAEATRGLPGVRRDRTAYLPLFPVDVARRYGLRLAGKRTQGWVGCRAINREDKEPSASIHGETGYYIDFGSGVEYSFWELLQALGATKQQIMLEKTFAQPRRSAREHRRDAQGRTT